MRNAKETGEPRAGWTVARNVACALLGAGGLVLKGRYAGPYGELVHSYGGNVTASFAVYFILATQLSRMKCGRALRAAVAMGVVDLFEATDGFGVMSNTYDPFDYLANGVGVVLAVLVDTITNRIGEVKDKRA